MKALKSVASSLFAASLCFASSGAWALCGGGTATPASTVTPTGSGSFDYAYTVFGDVTSCVSFYGPNSFYITQFAVPYFPDAGVTGITSPAGWTYQIVATDSFGLGSGAETLVWTANPGMGITPTNGLTPASSLSGFGYVDTYAPVKGPASLTYSGGFSFNYDPALPGSGMALADGLQPAAFPVSPVPEPSTWAMIASGLMLFGFIRARKT